MKARFAGLLLSMVSTMGVATQVQAMPSEWTLGAELGGGRSTRTTWSPSFGVRGAYGLAEALDVQVELSGQWLRGARPTFERDDVGLRLVPALVYKLDVLRWVPFARLGVGPTWAVPLTSGHDAQIAFAAQGALGVDYIVDRSLSLSVAYQADWALGKGELPARLAPMHRLLLTVAWRSGW